MANAALEEFHTDLRKARSHIRTSMELFDAVAEGKEDSSDDQQSERSDLSKKKKRKQRKKTDFHSVLI